MPARRTGARLEELKIDITARLASTQRLFNKLDTSGWPTRDLEAFEALIEEKRQIEKQHHKNVINDVATRERKLTTTDLRAKDNSFKYDHGTAGYKSTGAANKCAMDDDSGVCHHEVCTQARAAGISYLEYDTIMHYKQRIAAAKTTRMKDALRKQRDVQLIKDQKAGQDWKEKAMKKFGSLGKEAGDAILGAASQVTAETWIPPTLKEDIRPDNAVEAVGRALSKLRLTALPKTNQEFASIVQARITGRAATHTYNWRNPAQFLDFFAKVQISHIDAAVMNIRDVFELNALLPYEVEYCLREMVEQCRHLIMHVARNRKNVLGYTLGEALHDVKEIIKAGSENSTLERPESATGVLPKNAIYNVLVGCISVETHYSTEMMFSAAKSVRDQVEPDEKLKGIEQQGLADSPLPFISSKHFVHKLEQGRKHATVHWLLDMAERRKATSNELEEVTISRIQHIAGADAHRYLDIWDEISELEDRLSQLDSEKPYAHQHDMIRTALDTAKVKLSRLSADSDESLREQEHRLRGADIKEAIQNLRRASNSKYIQYFPGMASPQNHETDVLFEYVRHGRKAQSDPDRGTEWTPVISKYIWRGVTELYYVQSFLANPSALPDHQTLSLFMRDPEKHALLFARRGYTLTSFLYDRRREGWCLASAIVRLLVILPYICSLNPLTAKNILMQFSTLFDGCLQINQILPDWTEPLRVLRTAILHTYGYFTIECTHVFGRSDVEQVVFTLLWRLIFHALIAPTKEEATRSFLVATEFAARILNAYEVNVRPWFSKVSNLVENIIEKHEIRCGSPDLCAVFGKVACDQHDEYKHLRVSGNSTTKHTTGTTIHEHVMPPLIANSISRRIVRPQNSRFSAHDQLLCQIINQPNFGVLAASRVLKYLAHRMKADASISCSLDTLWQAFLRTETAIRRTPSAAHFALPATIPTRYADDTIETTASSLCVNMHNHCNIWDLCSSPEKACGFFEGYKHGFRTRRDIDILLESLTLYAIQHGCDSRVETKSKQLMDILTRSGYWCPAEIAECFKQVKSYVWEQVQDEPEVKARADFNKLDEIRSVFPNYATPIKQFIDDLLMWPCVFEKYYTTLVDVLEHLGSSRDVIKVKLSGEALLGAVEQDPEGSSIEDPAVATISDAAEDAWRRTGHKDVIYSETEEEEKGREASAGTEEDNSEQVAARSPSGREPLPPNDDSSDLSDSTDPDEPGFNHETVFCSSRKAPAPPQEPSDSDRDQSGSSGFDIVNLRGPFRADILPSAGLNEDDLGPVAEPDSDPTPAMIHSATQTYAYNTACQDRTVAEIDEHGDLMGAHVRLVPQVPNKPDITPTGDVPPNIAELETLQNVTSYEQQGKAKRHKLELKLDPTKRAAQWAEKPEYDKKLYLNVLIESGMHTEVSEIMERMDAIKGERAKQKARGAGMDAEKSNNSDAVGSGKLDLTGTCWLPMLGPMFQKSVVINAVECAPKSTSSTEDERGIGSMSAGCADVLGDTRGDLKPVGVREQGSTSSLSIKKAPSASQSLIPPGPQVSFDRSVQASARGRDANVPLSETAQRLRDRSVTPYPAGSQEYSKRRDERRRMVVSLFSQTDNADGSDDDHSYSRSKRGKAFIDTHASHTISKADTDTDL